MWFPFQHAGHNIFLDLDVEVGTYTMNYCKTTNPKSWIYITQIKLN